VLLVGHLFLDRDYYYIYSNVARVAHNFSRRLPAVYPPFTRRLPAVGRFYRETEFLLLQSN